MVNTTPMEKHGIRLPLTPSTTSLPLGIEGHAQYKYQDQGKERIEKGETKVLS